jgi:putative ABC transport system permease protein
MRLLPGFSALDFKVGLRMLARYPGLTIVGTVAISIAVALGTIYFETTGKFLDPHVPASDGAPIVQIRNWDVSSSQEELRLLHDYATWRGAVQSIVQLGAAITYQRNLATDDKRIEPVAGADVSAQAFQVMGTAPLLGRTLTTRDENAGEPPVVVIGESIWESRFERDPGVVGRTVKIGTMAATIVGVMPARFGFPMNQRIWTPLRTDGSTIPPRSGPSVVVFGKLAPNASMDDARAELQVIGARLSAASPKTHEHLRPRVTAYQKPLAEAGQMRVVRNGMYAVNSVFLMLLAIMCANIATLVFARTATRSWELTVRSALGASRARIIAQLFIEALVLTTLAATVGLVIARTAMRYGLGRFETGGMPFWIDATLSPRTFVYAAVLALFGAAIVGVLPGLRATRVNIQDALKGESAGRAGLKFGGFWTGIIVMQVAITVMFLPLAAGGVFESNRFNQRAEGIGADKFLTAVPDIDAEDFALDSATFAGRKRNSLDELERRLMAEPGVEHVAYASRLPVEDQFKYYFHIDTAAGVPASTTRMSTLVSVSRGFFGAFGTSVTAGRDFALNEFSNPDARVVIVNQAFATNAFGPRNAIGQRIQIGEGEVRLGVEDQWFEIVGVVKNFGWQLQSATEQSAIYLPAPSGGGRAAQLAVRVRDPLAFAQRLRNIAADVDPTIRLASVQPLTKVGGGEAEANWTLTAIAWLIGFIVLLLSATGIHALMSFTVSRRTREIGIRVALGAHPRRIVTGIFARAFLQVGAGVVVGSALAAWAGFGDSRQMLLLLAADAIMLTVGMAACALPVKRALGIHPTDALRAE